MTTKYITAKSLRDNLRDVIVEINNSEVEFILEYTKGMKVKITSISQEPKISKFKKFLNSKQWKDDKDYKPMSNDDIRKLKNQKYE